MLVLGLTGSIGMGKTTTAALLREAGVPVFDADAVVHDLYRNEAVPAVADAFPGVLREGVVDRALLRDRVLGDPTAMQRLEAIVHPLVRARRERFLDEARSAGHRVAFLDIPLLYETGADREVVAVMVVSAPEAVQKARVLARPGMTEAAFSAIMAKQMPDGEKRRRADVVIETGSGIEAARMQVHAALGELRRRLDG